MACAVVEFPAEKHWEINDYFGDSSSPHMIEFRLVFQGRLPSDADSKTKHSIRRYFHPQLVKLWESNFNLKHRAQFRHTVSDGQTGQTTTKTGLDLVAERFCMGNQKFIPIVQKEWDLCCTLDILILRQNAFPIIKSGDLDNQAKTIVDALRIPAANEYSKDSESPFYCLMEDDKLVSEIKLSADLLACPPEQIVHDPRMDISGQPCVAANHALVLVHVRIKPTHVATWNMDFL